MGFNEDVEVGCKQSNMNTYIGLIELNLLLENYKRDKMTALTSGLLYYIAGFRQMLLLFYLLTHFKV